VYWFVSDQQQRRIENLERNVPYSKDKIPELGDTMSTEFDDLLNKFECLGRQLGETFWKLPDGRIVTGETLEEIESQI
jgi:hypothetical protein